eukprot:496140-Amphidinium_carterae.1
MCPGKVVKVCVACVDAQPKQLLRHQPPAPTASSSSTEHVARVTCHTCLRSSCGNKCFQTNFLKHCS